MLEAQNARQETIWLCGKPRFLRELLGYVLKETVGTTRVHQVADIEPPRLTLPEYADWLIWFLNAKHEIATALEKVSGAQNLNLLLIQRNGDTLVRWADGTESQYLDISLPELENLVQTPLAPENVSQTQQED